MKTLTLLITIIVLQLMESSINEILEYGPQKSECLHMTELNQQGSSPISRDIGGHDGEDE